MPHTPRSAAVVALYEITVFSSAWERESRASRDRRGAPRGTNPLPLTCAIQEDPRTPASSRARPCHAWKNAPRSMGKLLAEKEDVLSRPLPPARR